MSKYIPKEIKEQGVQLMEEIYDMGYEEGYELGYADAQEEYEDC